MSNDNLPKWIDDAKGKDPFTDDLISEIIRLRAAVAASGAGVPPGWSIAEEDGGWGMRLIASNGDYAVFYDQDREVRAEVACNFLRALAAAPTPDRAQAGSSSAAPSELSKQLRQYAADPGMSRVRDAAMLAAADELDRLAAPSPTRESLSPYANALTQLLDRQSVPRMEEEPLEAWAFRALTEALAAPRQTEDGGLSAAERKTLHDAARKLDTVVSIYSGDKESRRLAAELREILALKEK